MLKVIVLFAVFLLSHGGLAVGQADQQSQWRPLVAENTLYMDTEQGRVVFELTPQFSPKHVVQFKKLVRSGFYDGLTFYRVIDGFVVQGGDPDGKVGKSSKAIKAEFEWAIDSKSVFTLVQAPDLLAEQTGFIDGFALGRSLKENREWLLSCPGVINLARSSDPDSGTTDFAIMVGRASRYLDRNMSIFGRIVYGMEHLNLIKRGRIADGGTIADVKLRSKIVKMTIAADLPLAQRLVIAIENTDSEVFRQKLADKRSKSHEFFVHKGNGALDICNISVGIQVNSGSD